MQQTLYGGSTYRQDNLNSSSRQNSPFVASNYPGTMQVEVQNDEDKQKVAAIALTLFVAIYLCLTLPFTIVQLYYSYN